MTPDIKPMVAGNWKMNGQRDMLDQLALTARGVDEQLAEKVDVLLCPPSTLLYVATTLTEDTALMVGAQDCHSEKFGAHTGDISAEMIADCFAEFCIVGHSERRADYGESDFDVNAKASAAWRADLEAIICIGETEAEYDAGQAREVLARQLASSVPQGASDQNTIIAYEPVWAIGTGKTATKEQAQEVHAFIRKLMAEMFEVSVLGF